MNTRKLREAPFRHEFPVKVIDKDDRVSFIMTTDLTMRGRAICAHPDSRVVNGVCGACGREEPDPVRQQLPDDAERAVRRLNDHLIRSGAPYRRPGLTLAAEGPLL